MEEVFGTDNFCRVITIRKTAGDTTTLLTSQADYLLWYAKDADCVKYRPLFVEKEVGAGAGTQYDRVFDPETGFQSTVDVRRDKRDVRAAFRMAIVSNGRLET